MKIFAATLIGLLLALLVVPTAILATAAEPSPAATVSAEARADIPDVMLAGYQQAAGRCPGLPWTVIAAIGKIESDHGRFAGSQPTATGLVAPPIIGVPLDGSPGVAFIRDTDDGRFDGDTVYDRAVGPMQFIPTTWRSTGIDGDGDGVADPHDLHDALPTTAAYLCRAGGNEPGRLRKAIWTYNHSWVNRPGSGRHSNP